MRMGVLSDGQWQPVGCWKGRVQTLCITLSFVSNCHSARLKSLYTLPEGTSVIEWQKISLSFFRNFSSAWPQEHIHLVWRISVIRLTS